MNQRHPSMKLIASAVVFTFTLTSLGITPDTFAATGVPALAGEVSPLTAGTLAIPAELGQVTETVTGDPKAPAFIHIQSAHGNYQAEKNIENLLGYIEKNSSVKTMFLEGAAGKLNPELFRLFPGNPDFNRKVTDKLMQEGYLTGPESFLIENSGQEPGAKGHKNAGQAPRTTIHVERQNNAWPVARGSWNAFGVEDLEAYKKDREAFINVVKKEKTAENYLMKLRASIDKRFASKLNKDLLTLVRQEESLGSGTVSFASWIKTLGEGSKKHLKTDLSDAFYQDQYPSLIRYFRLQAIGSKIDRDKANAEEASFLKELEKRGISMEIIGTFRAMSQEPRTTEEVRATSHEPGATNSVDRGTWNVSLGKSDYSPLRAAFDHAFDKLPKDFSMKAWPNWTLYAQFTILMQEMESKGLQEETVRLKEKIQTALAKTPEEKEYLAQARQLYLLRRLFALELTREEYEELNNRATNHEPRTTNSVAHGPWHVAPEAQALFATAMDFYSTAVLREEKMFQNALRKMSDAKQQRAVIVTGGFHADGLKKLAQAKNCSYIQITPRIAEVSKRDHEVYLRSVLGTVTHSGRRRAEGAKTGTPSTSETSEVGRSHSAEVEKVLSKKEAIAPSAILHPSSVSDMSSLLGLVDRAQRVAVTGVAATKGWARDIRGIVSGMINSESDNSGLDSAFSNSVFGVPAPALAPAMARAEVREEQTNDHTLPAGRQGLQIPAKMPSLQSGKSRSEVRGERAAGWPEGRRDPLYRTMQRTAADQARAQLEHVYADLDKDSLLATEANLALVLQDIVMISESGYAGDESDRQSHSEGYYHGVERNAQAFEAIQKIFDQNPAAFTEKNRGIIQGPENLMRLISSRETMNLKDYFPGNWDRVFNEAVAEALTFFDRSRQLQVVEGPLTEEELSLVERLYQNLDNDSSLATEGNLRLILKDIVRVSVTQESGDGYDYDLQAINSWSFARTVRNERAFKALKSILELNPSAFTQANRQLLQKFASLVRPSGADRIAIDFDTIINWAITEALAIFDQAQSRSEVRGKETSSLDSIAKRAVIPKSNFKTVKGFQKIMSFVTPFYQVTSLLSFGNGYVLAGTYNDNKIHILDVRRDPRNFFVDNGSYPEPFKGSIESLLDLGNGFVLAATGLGDKKIHVLELQKLRSGHVSGIRKVSSLSGWVASLLDLGNDYVLAGSFEGKIDVLKIVKDGTGRVTGVEKVSSLAEPLGGWGRSLLDLGNGFILAEGQWKVHVLKIDKDGFGNVTGVTKVLSFPEKLGGEILSLLDLGDDYVLAGTEYGRTHVLKIVKDSAGSVTGIERISSLERPLGGSVNALLNLGGGFLLAATQHDHKIHFLETMKDGSGHIVRVEESSTLSQTLEGEPWHLLDLGGGVILAGQAGAMSARFSTNISTLMIDGEETTPEMVRSEVRNAGAEKVGIFRTLWRSLWMIFGGFMVFEWALASGLMASFAALAALFPHSFEIAVGSRSAHLSLSSLLDVVLVTGGKVAPGHEGAQVFGIGMALFTSVWSWYLARFFFRTTLALYQQIKYGFKGDTRASLPLKWHKALRNVQLSWLDRRFSKLGAKRRSAAAKTLGKFGDSRAVSVLKDATQDRAVSVQLAATGALKVINGRSEVRLDFEGFQDAVTETIKQLKFGAISFVTGYNVKEFLESKKFLESREAADPWMRPAHLLYSADNRRIADSYNDNIEILGSVEDPSERQHDMPGFMGILKVLFETALVLIRNRPVVVVTDGGTKSRPANEILLFGYTGLWTLVGPRFENLREVNAVNTLTMMRYLGVSLMKKFIGWAASDNFIFLGEAHIGGVSLSDRAALKNRVRDASVIKGGVRVDLLTEADLVKLDKLPNGNVEWTLEQVTEALEEDGWARVKGVIDAEKLTALGTVAATPDGKMVDFMEKEKHLNLLVQLFYKHQKNGDHVYKNPFIEILGRHFAARLYELLKGEKAVAEGIGTLDRLPVSYMQTAYQGHFMSKDRWEQAWNEMEPKDKLKVPLEDWKALKIAVDRVFAEEKARGRGEIYVFDFGKDNQWIDLGNIDEWYRFLSAAAGDAAIRRSLGIPVDVSVLPGTVSKHVTAEVGSYAEYVRNEGLGQLILKKGAVASNVLVNVPEGETWVWNDGVVVKESDLRGLTKLELGARNVNGFGAMVERVIARELGSETLKVPSDERVATIRVGQTVRLIRNILSMPFKDAVKKIVKTSDDWDMLVNAHPEYLGQWAYHDVKEKTLYSLSDKALGGFTPEEAQRMVDYAWLDGEVRQLRKDLRSEVRAKGVLPRVDPSKLEEWKHLKGAARLKPINLAEEDRNDGLRRENLSVDLGDLYFDGSKNLITRSVLKLLVTLAEKTGLRRSIDLMFAGAPINETEDRSVFHPALRNIKKDEVTNEWVSAGPMIVDGKDVMPEVLGVLKQMAGFVEEIYSGKRRGYTGQEFKNVVVEGIGGSYLGPEMAVLALEAFRVTGMNFYFVANVDGADVASKVTGQMPGVPRGLNPEETLVIVLSKTFTTQETIMNASTTKEWLLKHYQGDEKAVASHFVAVSTAGKLVKAFGIELSNMFGFWDWVGGRYSMWSAIGLPIMLAVGPENFYQMLAGAHEMDVHFRTAPFEKNIPVLKALLDIWNRIFLNMPSVIVAPYSQLLSRLGAYLQQAFMESNGKSVDRNGDRVTYSTSTQIYGEAMTNGQHAYQQQPHQGTEAIPEDHIGFINPSHKVPEHHEVLTANLLGQIEALAVGKTTERALAELKAFQNNDPKKFEGWTEETFLWLAKHKTFEGNKPTNLILIDELTPRTFGKLIAMYEHQVAAEGFILNIFSFDQWGVELGKVLATMIRPLLKGADMAGSGLTASTAFAIRRIIERTRPKEIAPVAEPKIEIPKDTSRSEVRVDAAVLEAPIQALSGSLVPSNEWVEATEGLSALAKLKSVKAPFEALLKTALEVTGGILAVTTVMAKETWTKIISVLFPEHLEATPVLAETFASSAPIFRQIVARSQADSAGRMVIDQRQGIPDAASVLPLVTFARYNPKASVVLALIADASEVAAFEKELAQLHPDPTPGVGRGVLPRNFKVRAFADENAFVGAFAGFYNNAAPSGQSVALITDRENSVVTQKIGSRRHLLSVVGAQDPLKQTASTLLAADKLLNESIWSMGYHFVSVEKLGGLEALMAELTTYVAAQAKLLASA